MIDLSVPQRQSPLAIVFLGLRILRSLGIAQIVIVVLFIMRAPFNGALSVLPFVIIVAFGGFSALAWWRYTFQVLDDELVVTKGIVRVVRLNVPIERIQSIAIEQQLLHRLTGLVKVAVDTAGSNEAEFSIDAVARPVAEELQRRAVTAVPTPVKIGSALPPPVLAEDRVVFTHDGRRLLAMALTTWPLTGLLVLGPLLAFGGDFFNRLPDVGLGDQPFRWWWVPVGIAGFIVFSIVFNIIRVFLQDWELRLRASATSLRRTSRLLSRTS
ncbi:MAG: PH domain-containing protein, partial [Ilumatobacter sp.]|nr:PH domain-containing protein [Ilumatobacter sp.]